jgi:hypothetical protein
LLDRLPSTGHHHPLGGTVLQVVAFGEQQKLARAMTKSFWSCAIMTLVSAGVSAGFSLVGLFDGGSGDSFARYAASRSVALLLTVVIAICARSRMTLAVLGIAMTIVQAFYGVIGVLAHDPSKTYGPFAFAVLNALLVIRLLSEPAPGGIGWPPT